MFDLLWFQNFGFACSVRTKEVLEDDLSLVKYSHSHTMLLSKMLLSWLNTLLHTGYKKCLCIKDLGQIAQVRDILLEPNFICLAVHLISDYCKCSAVWTETVRCCHFTLYSHVICSHRGLRQNKLCYFIICPLRGIYLLQSVVLLLNLWTSERLWKIRCWC